jgi:hypothetical protein
MSLELTLKARRRTASSPGHPDRTRLPEARQQMVDPAATYPPGSSPRSATSTASRLPSPV